MGENFKTWVQLYAVMQLFSGTNLNRKKNNVSENSKKKLKTYGTK